MGLNKQSTLERYRDIMAQHDSHEYRFTSIEKRLDKLDQVHEIVTRLDERFDKLDRIYDTRTSALEKTSESHDKEIDDLKTFKWKAMGTIGLVLVIVSVFGSAIGNAIVKKFVSPAPNAQTSYYNETNLNGYLQAKDGVKAGAQQLTTPPKSTH